MSTNPAPTTWRVVRIEEDLRQVIVTLSRVEWQREDQASPVEIDGEDVPGLAAAEPGEPGAWWTTSDARAETSFAFPREQAMFFDVGRQYVLALTEIVDAPTSQYERA